LIHIPHLILSAGKQTAWMARRVAIFAEDGPDADVQMQSVASRRWTLIYH
jgi:hypothetical protein